MTAGERVRREIDRILGLYFEYGIALASNGASLTSENGIDQISFGNDKSLLIHPTVASYLNLLKEKQFSVLLSDGGIVQYTYSTDSTRITFHRLVFFPCPILFEKEEVEQLSIADLIENMSDAELVARTQLSAPMRFDFSPQHAAEDHSASHLHLRADSRIPVSGPVSPSQFTRFVMRYFYPANFRSKFRKLQGLALAETTSDGDCRDLHITSSFGWRKKPA